MPIHQHVEIPIVYWSISFGTLETKKDLIAKLHTKKATIKICFLISLLVFLMSKKDLKKE
jgi:hypothetical protein